MNSLAWLATFMGVAGVKGIAIAIIGHLGRLFSQTDLGVVIVFFLLYCCCLVGASPRSGL